MKVVFLFLALALIVAESGYSQDAAEVAKFPSRPITLIIPLPAGTVADLAMRVLAKDAQKYLGQPLVVVNKPGGGGSIGVAAIASAKPDGYTVGVATHSALYMVPLMEKVPYHPINDLKPIVQFSSFYLGGFVMADSPFKSFGDLIAYARENPKKVTYGDVGQSSMQNVIMEYVAKQAKAQLTHIPFKGTPEVQAALLGRHIMLGVAEANYGFFEAGQAKLLFFMSDERSPEFPQVPTLKDLGYSLRCPTPLIVVGPKGMPEGIAKKLESTFTNMMKEPAFIKAMKEDIHQPIVYRNSQELSEYMSGTFDYFSNFIKENKRGLH
jgi:tripartite-type tricarboxylate transporter receptor subunit TctC